MKWNYRILLLTALFGGVGLGLIGLGIMGCSGINRGAGERTSAGKMEKEVSETRVTAKPVNVVMSLKPHHQGAGLSCEDCHGSGTPQAIRADACLSCHGTSEGIAQSTEALKPNPHDSLHYGPDLDCDLCHHEHTTSENYCNNCHEFDMLVP